ncbi:threonine/serine exporter ThrE family protein [Rothia terrae]|uniref:threonine/serine ThrE exporter family protein n=1 Tax=Rothia terrae TaxID=396015 RepID=UPI002882C50D|nr:threonine/serine exporter family protein [Rothia terrae]MDT0188673.1 threonine/serine exporter family protein [Rothia terrae]
MSPSSTKIFEFLFDAGEGLLRSGASAASTTKTLLAICAQAGLKNVTVSIIVGQLTVSYQPEDGSYPISRVHNITPGILDIWWRSRSENTIERFLLGEIDIDQADREFKQFYQRQKNRSTWWWTTSGYGILGMGFSILLGGDFVTTLGAVLVSMCVSMLFRWLSRVGAPGIFSYAAGGFIAVLLAAGFMMLTNTNQATICVVSALAARLAGVTAYAVIQDSITGWYLSAAGRFVDIAVCTAGLISGVAAAIAAANPFIGDDVQLVELVTADTGSWFYSILGAALVAGGFALASGGLKIRLVAMTVLGSLAQALYLVMTKIYNVETFFAIFAVGTIIGGICVMVSRKVSLTSNALMLVALLPLFPGLMIYQGALSYFFGIGDSGTSLMEALVTTYCLSMGGTLGQYLVSQAMWQARKQQFRRRYPDGNFDTDQAHEYQAQDIMLPIFSKPFNSAEPRE